MAENYDSKGDVAVPAGNDAALLRESETPVKMSVSEYVRTRIPTLKPPMNKAPNPIRLLMMLNGKQWLFFLVGFIGWVRLHISLRLDSILQPAFLSFRTNCSNPVMGCIRFFHRLSHSLWLVKVIQQINH